MMVMDNKLGMLATDNEIEEIKQTNGEGNLIEDPIGKLEGAFPTPM